MVYTSHYMEEVEQLCTRIVIMDKGKTLATGTKEELKSMINDGETISVEMYVLDPTTLAQIRSCPTWPVRIMLTTASQSITTAVSTTCCDCSTI